MPLFCGQEGNGIIVKLPFFFFFAMEILLYGKTSGFIQVVLHASALLNSMKNLILILLIIFTTTACGEPFHRALAVC